MALRVFTLSWSTMAPSSRSLMTWEGACVGLYVTGASEKSSGRVTTSATPSPVPAPLLPGRTTLFWVKTADTLKATVVTVPFTWMLPHAALPAALAVGAVLTLVVQLPEAESLVAVMVVPLVTASWALPSSLLIVTPGVVRV